MRLYEMRKAKGLTQKQVADFAGADQSNISNYEKGLYRPKYDIASKLAELFGCSIREIMDGCTPEEGTQ